MTAIKRILVGTVFLLFATSSQAVLVETISNYAAGDIVTASAEAAAGGTTRVVHFNGATIFSNAEFTDPTKTLQPGVLFEHEYLFESVSAGRVALSLVTENGLTDLIEGFTLTILGSDGLNIVDNTSPLSLAFQMVAGEDYRIFLSGEATGFGSDYRLEVSAVPVPAAVWLFGSALLGLAGLRRKSKMDAVSA